MLEPDAVTPLERIVSPSVTIRRVRRWDGRGEARVQEGTRVEPGSVIAEVEERGPVLALDAARALGVGGDKVAGMLLVPVGEPVAQGQPLARKRGLLARTVTSPVDGTLILAGTDGHLLVRGNAHRRPLFAMMHGQVVHLSPGESVEIEGHGALVQGIWGNGQESTGLVRVMVGRADDPAAAERINAGAQGTILIAGATLDEAVLRAASEAEVRGLVAGSMDATLIPLAQSLPFPVLLTEGFGRYGFCPPAFDVLQTLNNREATLTARFQVGGPRPELWVSLPGEARTLPSARPLTSGDRVRLLSDPYLGRIGTVESNDGVMNTLPNGLLATTCAVRLDSGERLPVPPTNLERLLS